MNIAVDVYQREFAFVQSGSNQTVIRTSGFGPCYVVSFVSEARFDGRRYAALAHIDDLTNIESITDIFKRFQENQISLEDVKVVIMGGWQQHPESNKWGIKLVNKINEAGFVDINTELIFKKRMATSNELNTGRFNDSDCYYYGAQVDVNTGKTSLFKNRYERMERVAQSRRIEFVRQFGDDLLAHMNIAEFTITEVPSETFPPALDREPGRICTLL